MFYCIPEHFEKFFKKYTNIIKFYDIRLAIDASSILYKGAHTCTDCLIKNIYTTLHPTFQLQHPTPNT